MTAPWMQRVERAMRRVMPADGAWHKINTALDVHTGDGRVRFTFTCGSRSETVVLTAAEMDDAIRACFLEFAPAQGNG